MTIREYLKSELFKRGLFEDQCDAILDEAEQDEVCKGTMDGRWNDKIDDYPDMMKVTLFIAIRHVALAYIEKNIPQAWFKPMFQ